MDYDQKKDSLKVLAGTIYRRLHKPTTKGLHIVDKKDYIVDELKKKISVDLVHIVNMIKPGTN